jgi:hypothetical protein
MLLVYHLSTWRMGIIILFCRSDESALPDRAARSARFCSSFKVGFDLAFAGLLQQYSGL